MPSTRLGSIHQTRRERVVHFLQGSGGSAHQGDARTTGGEHAAIHRPRLQCPRTDDFTAGSSMTSTKQSDEAARDALTRMHRANRRGTGCHLTADMLQSLALTVIGEMWSDELTNSALSSAFGLCARLCGRTAKEGARSGTYFAAPDRPQNARIDRPPPVFLLASFASISPRLCRAFRNGHYTALTTFPRRARNTEILILVLRSQGVHVWSRQRAA